MNNYTFEYTSFCQGWSDTITAAPTSPCSLQEPLVCLKNGFLNIYTARTTKFHDWEELSFKHQQGDDYEQLLISFPPLYPGTGGILWSHREISEQATCLFHIGEGDDEQSQFICMPDIRRHSLLKSTEGIRTAGDLLSRSISSLLRTNSAKDEHVNAK